MAEKKVATEVAEEEFARWVEARDLDVDTSDMDEDDIKEFNQRKRAIIRAIERGTLTFEGADVVPEFKPRADLEPIRFSPPKGEAMLAGKKSMSEGEKLFELLKMVTGQPVILFKEMEARDVKVCAAIVVLLFS